MDTITKTLYQETVKKACEHALNKTVAFFRAGDPVNAERAFAVVRKFRTEKHLSRATWLYFRAHYKAFIREYGDNQVVFPDKVKLDCIDCRECVFCTRAEDRFPCNDCQCVGFGDINYHTLVESETEVATEPGPLVDEADRQVNCFGDIVTGYFDQDLADGLSGDDVNRRYREKNLGFAAPTDDWADCNRVLIGIYEGQLPSKAFDRHGRVKLHLYWMKQDIN